MGRRIDKDNPLRKPEWTRQKWETHNQFQYFEVYLMLPYGALMPDGTKVEPQTRSLHKLAELFTVSDTHVKQYSAAWAWQDRVRAYDEKVSAEKEAERERVRKAQAREMERRNIQYRNDAAEIYKQALGKLEQMLAFPISEDVIIEAVDSDGNPTGEVTHVLKPVKWNFNTMSKLIRELRELGKFASGQDNQGALDRLLERIDPAMLSDEQRQRILDGEDIIGVIISGATTEIQDTSTERARETRAENVG